MKAPGLYHCAGGFSNAPTGSLNFRSNEIGYDGRYSQIAIPWDADQMFFRRQLSNEQGADFTPWVEVVHSGNINTFTTPIQTALNLKAPLASHAFTGFISTIAFFVFVWSPKVMSWFWDWVPYVGK
jgi:hypothetical protein